MGTNATKGPVETMIELGFELEAMESLGLALEVEGNGRAIAWVGTFGGRCTASVASVEAAREWVRTNWRLFARKGA